MEAEAVVFCWLRCSFGLAAIPLPSLPQPRQAQIKVETTRNWFIFTGR